MDLRNELKKIKELVNEGLITQEDYDFKKKQLLENNNQASASNENINNKSVIGEKPRRKKLIALILVITPFGGLGFHRFYTGHYNTGLLMLCTFGVFGLMWIMDMIRLATNNFLDADGHKLI